MNVKRTLLGRRVWVLVGFGGWAMLSALLPPTPPSDQDRFVLRWRPKVGLTLQWLIQMTSRRMEDGRAETEKAELLVRERVEAARENGNLVWSSQIVRGVINGEPLPPEALEKTVSEVTPLGLPVAPPPLPAPAEATMEDWLTELLSRVTLTFPTDAVTFGQTWAYAFTVGLKPPNEPRRLAVTYRLERREEAGGTDCLRIALRCSTPIRLFWGTQGRGVTVTGGFRMEGAYCFDPVASVVRQRRITVTLGYTKESEVWDGVRFVQRTAFINQTTEVQARLVAP